MTAPGGDSDKLASLLTSLLGKVELASAAPEATHEHTEPLIHLLLYSFLLWESTPTQATAALARLYDAIIDPNELRVSMPEEIEAWIGLRDRHSLERAERMRATLNGIYREQHLVTLQGFISASKRDVRDYLDALEGMPSFVAARVTLLGFHGHAVPVDQKLCAMLTQEDVLSPKLSPDEGERWLERQIRASDTEQIVLVLDAWRDIATKPRPARKPRSKGSPSQTGKQTSTTSASSRQKKDA